MKLDGFAEKLALFTTSRRLVPYAWGTNDCATFAADAVLAVTGVDPIADIRGTWSSESEAVAILGEHGGLVAYMDARFPRRDVNFAQRGDVVLVWDVYGQPSLAVCTGSHAAAPGDEDLMLTPMTEARIAWEI